jgi:hypothetical protein
MTIENRFAPPAADRYRQSRDQKHRRHGTLIFVLIGQHFRQLFDRWRLTRHLAATSRISAALCSSHRDAAIVLACSVAIHLITAAAAWCCAKAIASPVSFAQILFLMTSADDPVSATC